MVKSLRKRYLWVLLVFLFVSVCPETGLGQRSKNVRGRCGDQICDQREKNDPNLCPRDCGESAGLSFERKPLPNKEIVILEQDNYIISKSNSRFGFLAAYGQDTMESHLVWKKATGRSLISSSSQYLQELGVGWSREVSFFYKANGKGAGNLSLIQDQKLKKAKAQGLKVIATILIEEKDYQSNKSDYIAWLKNIVHAYEGYIDFWQIHNEVGKRGRFQSSFEYAKLMLLSSEIIKNECRSCKIMMGSPIPDKVYYQACIPIVDRYVDAYDFHVFNDNDFMILRDFMSFVRSLNQFKPVFITEMGTYSGQPQYAIDSSNTRFPYQSEKQQAQILLKWHVKSFALGVDYIFWNELIEWYKFKNMLNGLFDLTGLVYNGVGIDNFEEAGKRKEAFFSYKTLIEKIDLFESVQILGPGMYKFFVKGRPVYVLWCEDPGQLCRMPDEIIQGEYFLTDYLGNKRRVSLNDIVVSADVIFLEPVFN